MKVQRASGTRFAPTVVKRRGGSSVAAEQFVVSSYGQNSF